MDTGESRLWEVASGLYILSSSEMSLSHGSQGNESKTRGLPRASL